jgi:hypothetical protein
VSEDQSTWTPRAHHPVADLLGAVLRGKRPEDREARRTVRKLGLVATLIAMLSWMPWLLVRGDNRIDRILEAQQRDLHEAILGVHRLAAAVEAQTVEARETRTTLLEKIPDARPSPAPVRIRPERGSR